ncbi:MAG: hypothetical protein WCA19_14360 [Candidatus Acidiferrales bacterium]
MTVVEQIRDAPVEALDGSAGLVNFRGFSARLVSGQVAIVPGRNPG